jgi:hypothetical protein
VDNNNLKIKRFRKNTVLTVSKNNHRRLEHNEHIFEINKQNDL